jgi:hypothetical protein
VTLAAGVEGPEGGEGGVEELLLLLGSALAAALAGTGGAALGEVELAMSDTIVGPAAGLIFFADTCSTSCCSRCFAAHRLKTDDVAEAPPPSALLAKLPIPLLCCIICNQVSE